MSNLNQDNTQTRKVVPAILMAAGAVGLVAIAAQSMFNGPADALSASPDYLAETAMLQQSATGSDLASTSTPAPAAEMVPAIEATDAIGAPRVVRDAVAGSFLQTGAFNDATEQIQAPIDPYEAVEAQGFEKPVQNLELAAQSISQILADAKPLRTLEPTSVAPANTPVALPSEPTVAAPIATPIAAPIADVASTSDSFVREGLSVRGDVRLSVAGSQVVTTNRPFTRVSVGSPDIAEVNPLGADSLLITAKATGHTQLILWDDNEKSEMIQVAVEPDFAALRDAMAAAFPGQQVTISPVGNTIALQGRVSDIDTAEQMLEIASTFSDGVVNLLEIGGGQTVMLRVRFAEVSRDMSRELGINFGFQDGPTIFTNNIGNIAPLGIGSGPALSIPSGLTGGVQAAATGSVDGAPFAVFINALKDANLLRMLSEPNVTVMSGETGTMLAGGEIPIPVPQEQNITIDYKEFGVRLDYTPTVLGDGRVRLNLRTRSSDLDYSRAVVLSGLQVPALRTKENSTIVEMAPGQTLMIGGLLESRVTANKQSVPGLGELPLIGALFRSVRYERAETELVVMVTPTLVEATNPADNHALPGERWQHPSDAELYGNGSFGKDISREPIVVPTPARTVDVEVIDAQTSAADGKATDAVAVKENEVVVIENTTAQTEQVPVAQPEQTQPRSEAINPAPRRETTTPVVIEPTQEPAQEPTPKLTTQRELPAGPSFIGFIGFSEN